MEAYNLIIFELLVLLTARSVKLVALDQAQQKIICGRLVELMLAIWTARRLYTHSCNAHVLDKI
jgi:hypothetical protein